MIGTDRFAAYEHLKPECLATIRAWHGATLGAHDADVLYQTAWIELWRRVDSGREVHDLRGFLLTAMTRRWRDELRRAHRRHELPLGARLVELARTSSEPPDVELRTQLRFALEALSSAVDDDGARRLLSLTWLAGLTREQAASELGIDWNRPFAKRLDRASKRLRDTLEVVRAGGWCEQQRPLLRELTAGRLEPGSRRWRQARAHLVSCTPCRRATLAEHRATRAAKRRSPRA